MMKLGRRSQSFALIRKFSSQHTQNKDYVKSFGIGLVSGILGALVGVGGSLVAIPLLTQFSGLPQHVAQGSAMVTAVFSSAGATIFNISNHISVSENEKVPNHVGNMHIPTVLSIAGPGSVAAVLGARLASKVSSRGLKISLGLFQIFVAPSAPLREYVLKYKQTLSKDVIEKNKSNEFLVSLVIGGFSGLIAGFFGVGGGAVTVPALCLFTDLDYKTALGTSLGAMFPTAVAGCITHYRQGTMLVRVAAPVGVGCFIGSFVGNEIAKNADEKQLRYLFWVLFTGLGSRQLYQGLRMLK